MIVKPTWLEAQFMVGWHFVLNSTCPRRLFRAFKIILTKKEANIFPSLHLVNSVLDLIRDLGHIIKNDQCDDGDVQQHCRWIQKWPSLKACCTLNLYSSFVVQLQPSKSGKIFRWCTDKTCQLHVRLVMLLKLLVWWRTVSTSLSMLTNFCECRCNNRNFLYWPGLWTLSVYLFKLEVEKYPINIA